MSRFKKINYYLFWITLGLTGYSSATAKELSADSSSGLQLQKSQPFHIKHADRLLWQTNKGNSMAILSGQVDLYLEKDQISIAADTVWYYPDSKLYKAAGHVKITKTDPVRGKIVASSQRAKYEQNQNRIVLEDSPKVIHDNDELTGDILILLFDKDGTILEGENVTGIFYPESEGTKS